MGTILSASDQMLMTRGSITIFGYAAASEDYLSLCQWNLHLNGVNEGRALWRPHNNNNNGVCYLYELVIWNVCICYVKCWENIVYDCLVLSRKDNVKAKCYYLTSNHINLLSPLVIFIIITILLLLSKVTSKNNMTITQRCKIKVNH